MRPPGPAARVALVGEAPSRSSGPDPFVGGRSGRRLRELGLDLDAVALYNLLPAWPGSAGKGSRFRVPDARGPALELLPALAAHARVVVAGKRAAAALGFREPYLVWAEGPTGGRWAVLPHPSGVNRWWNDGDNVDAAARFLRKLRP